MVFRWGQDGYAKKPNGPRFVLVHRDDDTPVPVAEIENALLHLDLPAEIFWDIVDHSASASKESPSPRI